MSRPPFLIKIRINEMEVELGGDKVEVLEALDDLPRIVEKFSSAFQPSHSNHRTRPRRQIEAIDPTNFPQIKGTSQCSEAVGALLSTEWGKTPRTIAELREAMEANAIFFPKTTLSGVLVWLVKKGTVRRWKDKKRGYLYTMNKDESEV